MKKIIYLALLVTALLLTGCSTNKKITSFVDGEPILITDIIVYRLVNTYPPAKIKLNLGKSQNPVFDKKLEDDIRRAGYEVSTDGNTIKINYIIDKISECESYIFLTDNRGFKFSQVFNHESYKLNCNYTKAEVINE